MYDGAAGGGMKQSYEINKKKQKQNQKPNNQKHQPKEPQLFRDWINSKKHV